MKPRIKHRQMPGDIPKREKIAMREHPHAPQKRDKKLSRSNKTWTRRAKSYKKMLQARERAVLKERAAKDIQKQQE